MGSWFPALAPERRRKDGARSFCGSTEFLKNKLGVRFEVSHPLRRMRAMDGAPLIVLRLRPGRTGRLSLKVSERDSHYGNFCLTKVKLVAYL